MSNETNPLTAEEFVKDFFGDTYCMVGLEERQNLHAMLNEYADQQTAALRGQLEAMKKERCEALQLLNHIQSTPQYFMQVHVRERIRRFLERTDDAY
ncbi:hypothetical protein [Chitinophaga sp.]|uniref:hypothetical protein n=1 Tax=Chitinophaga sp. TaxID=1869181 RepID=UPI0031E2AC82